MWTQWTQDSPLFLVLKKPVQGKGGRGACAAPGLRGSNVISMPVCRSTGASRRSGRERARGVRPGLRARGALRHQLGQRRQKLGVIPPSTPSTASIRRRSCAARRRPDRPRSRPPPPRRGCRNRPPRTCRPATAPSRRRSPTGRSRRGAAAAQAASAAAWRDPSPPRRAARRACADARRKRRPQLPFGAAALLGDRLQSEEHGAVGEIGPRHDVLDAVEDHRPGGVEQHLVVIGVKLADGEAAAGREPAQRVGDEGGRPETLSKASTWLLWAAMNRSRSSRGRGAQRRGVGIEQRPQHHGEGRFRRALLAREHQQR